MSTNTNNTSNFDYNSNENILVSNEQSYDNLVGYCALRKQFSRIIPSYYTEIQKQLFKGKGKNVSSIEEYKKLKEEINIMKESIESLKELKQKKLKQIEDLRILMRKVGSKQISYKDKKINKDNNNNIINNYCAREISTTDQGVRCSERKGNNNLKASSDEGLSMAPTTSGLSSGKDEEAGAEEDGKDGAPYGEYSHDSSRSGSWCFTNDHLPNGLMLQRREKEKETTTIPLSN
jgi:hypothetical protein